MHASFLFNTEYVTLNFNEFMTVSHGQTYISFHIVVQCISSSLCICMLGHSTVALSTVELSRFNNGTFDSNRFIPL